MQGHSHMCISLGVTCSGCEVVASSLYVLQRNICEVVASSLHVLQGNNCAVVASKVHVLQSNIYKPVVSRLCIFCRVFKRGHTFETAWRPYLKNRVKCRSLCLLVMPSDVKFHVHYHSDKFDIIALLRDCS
jgi:hypothetical protein